MTISAQDIGGNPVRIRDQLAREIGDLDAYNRAAGLHFNIGWGKRGGLFDKKLDKLRARKLLLDAQVAVLETA